MGKIEEIVKKSSRKEYVKAAILGSIQIGGLLAIAVVAPNVLGMLGKMGIPPKSGNFTVKRSLARLIDSGHVRVVVKENRKYMELTDKGRGTLNRLEARDFDFNKPKRWDGKFRILIFDVKEARRSKRDSFRLMLRRIGFKPIQQSVWAYPYDCEDVIQLIKTDIGIGKDVIYLVTGDIENKNKLIDLFGLGNKAGIYI